MSEIMSQICFADEKLRVVPIEKAKAIVNIRPDCWIEFLFLSPIAHDKNFAEAARVCEAWQRENYPEYSSSMPFYKTCQMANGFTEDGEKGVCCFAEPPIRNCYCIGTITGWRVMAVGENGRENLVSSGRNVLPNVFVSLLVSHREFKEKNPDIDILSYQMSYNPYEW